jgi:Protein of unknown function (DUF3710)
MRWSRRSRTGAAESVEPTTGGPAGASEAGDTPDPRADGPWDASEYTAADDEELLDLGSIAVPAQSDMQVQLQVDEATGEVAAVLLMTEDGAMELRAFAAPRNEDIWDDVRGQMAAEAKRRGGDSREVQGPYGTALQVVVPVVTPEGEQASQQSAVLGIAGPRWLLRASMYGRPAREWRPDGPLESLLKRVVVDRGGQPMTPGQALPLRLPAGAQRVQAP